MTLMEFFDTVYLRARPLSEDGKHTYRAAISQLQRFAGRELDLTEVSADLIADFMAAYREKWSASSTNNKRAHLLVIWRFAYRRKLHPVEPPDNHDLPKVKEPRREPKAWTTEEYGRLLAAAERMAVDVQNGLTWGPAHWKAFLLVQLDTAHRRGALLSYPSMTPPILTTRRDQVRDGFLTVLAEHTKQHADTVHKLHPDTLAAIEGLPPHTLLFPWPYAERMLDDRYRVLVALAGFTPGRKTGTHKNRRTSATAVAAKAGITAAARHCGHSTERMTIANYVDKAQMPSIHGCDVIDRPSAVQPEEGA